MMITIIRLLFCVLTIFCPLSPIEAQIIDNTDESCVRTGIWESSVNAGDFHDWDYEVTNRGNGERSFQWNYHPLESGFYQIRIFYPAAENRATNAKFTVFSGFGVDTVNVDQTLSAGSSNDPDGWIDLGIYPGTSGETMSVTLTNDADGYLIADAISIEPVAPLGKYIRDNTHSDCVETGVWGVSTTKQNYYGINYRHKVAGLGFSTFEWRLPILESGLIDLYVWWPVGSGVAGNAPFTVRHIDGRRTIRIDQRYNGGKWVPLGSFSVAPDFGSVSLSNDADDFVLADAVMVLPKNDTPVYVADDHGRNCLYYGKWYPANAHQRAWGVGYHQSKAQPGISANWTLNLPESGVYDLFARWTSGIDRSSAATYCIETLIGRECRSVDQRVDSGSWVRLGSFPLPMGKTTVALSSHLQAGYLIADAVKLEFVDPFHKGWYIRNITSTADASELTPMVDAGKVVWLTKNKQVIQIFDGKQIIDVFSVLGSPGLRLGAPNLSQGKIVWRMYDGKDVQSIYMWDGTQVQLIDAYLNEGAPNIIEPYEGYPPSYHCLNPVVYNGIIVYPKWDGNDYEIFKWEKGRVTQITDDQLDCIEPSLAKGKIAFVRWDRYRELSQDVYFGDQVFFEAIGTSPTDDQDPDTDGISAVFCAWEPTYGKKFDIYRYLDGELTNISFKNGGDYEPQVDGDLIVWHGQDGPGKDFDIYIWDNGVVYTLANSDQSEQHPWVYGKNVVWTASDGIQYDIHMATRVE